MTPTLISLQVLLQVTDAEEVISSGKDWADVESLEDCLFQLSHNPQKPAIDCGYELLQGSGVSHFGEDKYILTLNASVHSPNDLREAAFEAYEGCWGGSQLSGDYEGNFSLQDLLYEVAVASNATSSFADCGLLLLKRV